MPRKGVKCPLSWTLVAENIENVERVCLDVETQRELGCLVGEHVFLEYPWAYVNRDAVTRLSRSESPLAAFREQIEAYKDDKFLVGYSSTRLFSDDFVICLTQKAKGIILKRNRDISRAILNRVLDKIRKTARSWRCLGSEAEVDETFARNTRELLEIEIVLPGRALGLARSLCDRDSSGCRDSYVQLVNTNEEFANIERKCISQTCQTHLEPREASVQTYFSYRQNAWTQYVYEDILDEVPTEDNVEEQEEQGNGESERNEDERSKVKSDEDKKSEEGPKEKTAMEIFLESRFQDVIDVIRYNAAVNLHVDDIQSLCYKGSEEKLVSRDLSFREQLSLADYSFTNSRAVSDISLSPKSTRYMIISYVDPTLAPPEINLSERGFQCKALLWDLDDPLYPQLQLQDHRDVYCISLSPFDENVVIGGCSTGHVIIWTIKDYWDKDDINNDINKRDNNIVVARAIMVSDKGLSHQRSVRAVRWMTQYKIEPSGKLSRSSTSCGAQFLTVSEDSTVFIWNLPPFPNLGDADSDNIFHPVFRLKIRSSTGPEKFTPLCLCLPSVSVLEERNDDQQKKNQLSSTQKDYMKSLWLGCVEGLVRCTWEDQVLDEDALEVDCEILSHSCIHDGPVTQIQRSPYLQDILLTIGGHVFAIWKDDHLESPLFWRRMSCRYTASCWTSKPGVFVLGTQQGDLELWDIRSDSSWPVVSQKVSSKSITCLILLGYQSETSKTIGVGDSCGFFRVFEEPEIFGDEDVVHRMDWFEEYVWREVRRKKVFSGWQSDFLANDPAVAAKRAARRDEERNREVEEAREKLKREREEFSRLKAEKRARSAPMPKHDAWKAKEYERMKAVLLLKKSLDPVELEEKRLPLVTMQAERDAKLKKAEENVAKADVYFSRTLSVEFPELIESKEESEIEESVKFEKSVDDYLQRFYELRDRTREMLAKTDDLRLQEEERARKNA
ncbi:dynein axonemal intermediate chain 3 [Calliopsis andreniformis]|uniref:dynein axonemal intermediate chain 3 n=1 Tax=Calliopsis andreniformis TaxID=337506 RepID=UPI003FCDA2B6